MTDPLRISTSRLRLVLLRHVAPRVADEVLSEIETEPEPEARIDTDRAVTAAARVFAKRGRDQ